MEHRESGFSAVMSRMPVTISWIHAGTEHDEAFTIPGHHSREESSILSHGILLSLPFSIIKRHCSRLRPEMEEIFSPDLSS
jgi:hypothetical protein